jgi:hypothetical protein
MMIFFFTEDEMIPISIVSIIFCGAGSNHLLRINCRSPFRQVSQREGGQLRQQVLPHWQIGPLHPVQREHEPESVIIWGQAITCGVSPWPGAWP